MSVFERYLTVRVGLCIVVGVALGHVMTGVFHTIGTAEVTKVNLPVAVLIWLMVIPMLLRIDFAALEQVGWIDRDGVGRRRVVVGDGRSRRGRWTARRLTR